MHFRIDDSWIIKVADFGLSENTGAKDYFRQDEASGAKLPVKWMAMESLEKGIFSEKTDVVSYLLCASIYLLIHIYIANCISN